MREIRNEGYRAAVPCPAAGMQLDCVFDVDIDAGYDVRPGPAWWRSGTTVALKTRAGRGCLSGTWGEDLAAVPGNLLLIDHTRLTRYRTDGERWAFWWFYIRPASALPAPLHRELPARDAPDDESDFAALLISLQHPAPGERIYASSLFGMMLHRWLRDWRDDAHNPHRVAIDRVIELMHARLDGSLGLAEMAQAAHLGERRFRQVFAQITGESPKRYYDGLRVHLAAEWLRLGVENVSTAALRLGFSSPYHFSRTFRQRTGQPPSALLPGRTV